MNLNELISNLGIRSNLAGDVSFLILFLLVSFALSFALGRHRLLVSLLGVYVAYTIISFSSFDLMKDPDTRIIVFLALLAGFILFFSRMIRANVSGLGPALIFKLFLGTAIVLGLLLSVILSDYPSRNLLGIVSPGTSIYFTGDIYKFLWAIAPVVYLAIIRKKME